MTNTTNTPKRRPLLWCAECDMTFQSEASAMYHLDVMGHQWAYSEGAAFKPRVASPKTEGA